MNKIFFIVFIGLLVNACTPRNEYTTVFRDPVLYSKTVGALTDVITHDIFSPPVASRIYAYSNLAAYEVMASKSAKYKSLSGKLTGLHKLLKPEKPVNIELASLLAFMYVGQELTFSKDSTQKIIDGFIGLAKAKGMPAEMIENSQNYANEAGKAVIDWSKKDNYKQMRSAVKYTVNNSESRWVPTPPAYMPAVEPNWMKLRPVLIDSASQFLPIPPSEFSKDKDSKFYSLAMEVYKTGSELSEEQKAIADFWDCNGFKMNISGHVMFATKAMTPGGHWMGITGIVCNNQKADFAKTVFSYTGVSFAIMDSFIACWNTKFVYSLLRPETYINLYIDDNWRPYLQTPPFPEYTSGHSIISSASATVLTSIFGKNTAFTDSTERRWGWPDRKFASVKQAAQEAAVSRLYGGIHYREAMDEGSKEGAKIGEFVFNKIN
ncbi:vanadium-dependent haloperoxidase [Daejeonella sp.]|uniref:vanadium-dependent haloperoxidase n=1 Tax=Daejeonella sp. TaxID=2805397 RepID=UPI0030BABE22